LLTSFFGTFIANLNRMRNKTLTHCLISYFVLLFSFGTLCLAQEPKVKRQADIPSLIRKLEDKDERVVISSADSLIDAGSQVIPALIAVLKEKKECQIQFVASGVIYQLDRKNEIVNSTLIDIVRGKCKGSLRNDLIIRRQAAFALVGKAEGIPVIADMLKDKDTFVRRSAAFAFDDLTERLEGRPPEVRATPEIIRATKAALPFLAQALNDKDEIVRCMSYESLEQTQRSKHEELRSEANRFMQGVTVRCSR
jgi:hypothetical protein